MRGEHGAVGELGLVVGEQALEPEHERELASPLDRRLLAAGVELRQRGIERAAAGGALRQRRGGVLALEHERLARELLRAPEIGAGNRRGVSQGSAFSQ